MEQVGICAGSGQARHQAVLEHIAGAAGVLANDDAGRVGVAVALSDHIVIPTKKTTNLIGVISGQSDPSFTTEAIGSKVFSHYRYPSISFYFP